MSKFVIIDKDTLYRLPRLLEAKIDNAYIILDESNGYADLAQYSAKYDNIKIVTVLADNLDRSKALHEA